MIKCPICATEWVEGTMFCENCGTYLATTTQIDGQLDDMKAPALPPLPSAGSGGSETGSLPHVAAAATSDHERPGTLPLPPGSTEPGLAGSRARRLRLLILNTGRLSNWLPDTEIQIGRSDRANGIFPQVDLDPDGGYEAGVSRRHAIISRNDETYYVMDLGSVNGSFLNKQRLGPQVATALKDGDELRLGNVVMKVVMETVS